MRSFEQRSEQSSGSSSGHSSGSAASSRSREFRTGRARFSYPVFLDLHGVPVLVVGGGRIGARKAHDLAAAGAVVRLVATVVSDHVDRGLFDEVREKAFGAEDLDDIRLVITATGNLDTDRRIAEMATDRNIWTNAADQPVDCEFILPAIVRAGRVTGAVSTDGASPALAKYLRDRLGELLDERVAEAADVLAAERVAVQARGESTEDIDWLPRVAALLGSPEIRADDR